MSRGLYKDGYSTFKNGVPPKMETNHPLGTLTFSDEYYVYIEKVALEGKDPSTIEFGGSEMPDCFTVLASIRFKASAFPLETVGQVSAIIIDNLCALVFASTPVIPTATYDNKSDALIAYCLEGTDKQREELHCAIYSEVSRFPCLAINDMKSDNDFENLIN